MDTTVINVKTKRQLKRSAQRVAQELGLPLGTIINAYLRDLVRERRVVFSSPPTPNPQTRKLLTTIEKDIRHGKNLSEPFDTIEDTLASLHAD